MKASALGDKADIPNSLAKRSLDAGKFAWAAARQTDRMLNEPPDDIEIDAKLRSKQRQNE